MEKLGNPAIRPLNHVARNASRDNLNIKGELEYQVCLGARQFHAKCLLTEQPGTWLAVRIWAAKADHQNYRRRPNSYISCYFYRSRFKKVNS